MIDFIILSGKLHSWTLVAHGITLNPNDLDSITATNTVDSAKEQVLSGTMEFDDSAKMVLGPSEIQQSNQPIAIPSAPELSNNSGDISVAHPPSNAASAASASALYVPGCVRMSMSSPGKCLGWCLVFLIFLLYDIWSWDLSSASSSSTSRRRINSGQSNSEDNNSSKNNNNNEINSITISKSCGDHNSSSSCSSTLTISLVNNGNGNYIQNSDLDVQLVKYSITTSRPNYYKNVSTSSSLLHSSTSFVIKPSSLSKLQSHHRTTIFHNDYYFSKDSSSGAILFNCIGNNNEKCLFNDFVEGFR